MTLFLFDVRDAVVRVGIVVVADSRSRLAPLLQGLRIDLGCL
ncbi:hypothetical protein [Pseudomonas sp. CGJS7]